MVGFWLKGCAVESTDKKAEMMFWSRLLVKGGGDRGSALSSTRAPTYLSIELEQTFR